MHFIMNDYPFHLFFDQNHMPQWVLGRDVYEFFCPLPTHHLKESKSSLIPFTDYLLPPANLLELIENKFISLDWPLIFNNKY